MIKVGYKHVSGCKLFYLFVFGLCFNILLFFIYLFFNYLSLRNLPHKFITLFERF